MNAIINAMILSGNVANTLLLSVVGLMTICLIVWFVRFRVKTSQVEAQSGNFYNRRVNYLALRHQLSEKELDLLRDFARMERERRKDYYEHLNRNARYF